jgi:hypothetical protein
LQAAESRLEEGAFNRWPSVPPRNFGTNNSKAGAFVFFLSDPANDEAIE